MRKYFAFSLHKAGSTLFYKLLRKIANCSQKKIFKIKQLNYISVPHQLKAPDGTRLPEELLLGKDFLIKYQLTLETNNTIYGGFRTIPSFATKEFLKGAGVMLLVRDPRDILVSHYYSIIKSHRIPQGDAGKLMQFAREKTKAMTLDEFVIERCQEKKWKNNLNKISELKNETKYWRYEDVIFKKNEWLDEILAYMSINLPTQVKNKIVSSVDVLPLIEQKNSHIRQVNPGDHIRKLMPSTIELITNECYSFLNEWGYFDG